MPTPDTTPAPIPPPLPEDLALDLGAVYTRGEAATGGPWEAGRSDMISYHAGGGGPFKNVYADDPDGRMHMGERLPAVVCEAQDAVGADCRDNAAFIAAARTDLPALCRRLAAAEAECERLRSKILEYEELLGIEPDDGEPAEAK